MPCMYVYTYIRLVCMHMYIHIYAIYTPGMYIHTYIQGIMYIHTRHNAYGIRHKACLYSSLIRRAFALRTSACCPTHPSVTSVWGLKLLVYAALSYYCMALSYQYMRPEANSVWGLKLIVYEAWRYWCMRPWCMRPQDTSVCGLKLLVYKAITYWCMRP